MTNNQHARLRATPHMDAGAFIALDRNDRSMWARILQFALGNTKKLTDPTFEANQRDIVDQVRAVLVVAAGTL